MTHAPQATVRTACTSDADGASLHSTPATPALMAAETVATSGEPTSMTARADADAARSSVMTLPTDSPRAGSSTTTTAWGTLCSVAAALATVASAAITSTVGSDASQR